jgi:hypothetical protein
LFFIVFSFVLFVDLFDNLVWEQLLYKKAGEPSYEGFRLFLRIVLMGGFMSLFIEKQSGGGGGKLSTPQAWGVFLLAGGFSIIMSNLRFFVVIVKRFVTGSHNCFKAGMAKP